VIGSKGKGSTVYFLASILEEAGYKVGLFTSPFLLNIRATIKINQKLISKQKFTSYLEKIKLLSEKKGVFLTFFEILTTIAILYFREEEVDFGIFEAGLGGKKDATNCLHPSLTILTNIELEHISFLGKSLSQIAAAELAGVKKKGIVITDVNQREILKLIQEKCQVQETRVVLIKRKYRPTLISSSPLGTKINLKTPHRVYYSLQLSLAGKKQIRNAILAVAAIETLPVKITPAEMKRGLKKTYLPGRLEIVRKQPWVIFDGAHTIESVRNLKDFLNSLNYKQLILLFGVQKDKLYSAMIKEIFPLANQIILTQSTHPQALPVKKLAQIIPNKIKAIFKNSTEAFTYAFQKLKQDDCLVLTGSLYLIAEGMRYLLLRKQGKRIWLNF
jgi:dihydrofolate synthase/folylpolyglutamate synthase